MTNHQTRKILFIPQSTPVRKKLNRSVTYPSPRNNQVAPRSVFTCIDEIYSPAPVIYPAVHKTPLPLYVSSQDFKDTKFKTPHNCRQWLLTIIIIVVILCVIAIIVLLAVFLTR